MNRHFRIAQDPSPMDDTYLFPAFEAADDDFDFPLAVPVAGTFDEASVIFDREVEDDRLAAEIFGDFEPADEDLDWLVDAAADRYERGLGL